MTSRYTVGLAVKVPSGTAMDYAMLPDSWYAWVDQAMVFTGVSSITGPQGPQGIQGIQGIQGVQGPTGASTVSFSIFSGGVSASTFTYRVWHGRGTTAGGRCAFFPTTTGVSSGTSLFREVWNVLGMAPRNTTAVQDMLSISVTTIASDLRQVNVAATSGMLMLILGNSTQFAPDGTAVSVDISGLAY